MTRLATALVVGLLGIAVASCGGGDKHPSAHHLSAPRGLSGPQYGSAGSSDDYQPTGRIVARNDFDPGRDGFNFENYGGGTGAVDIDTIALIDLFGPGVCVNGSVVACKVAPQAEQFAQQATDAMGHGHCYGFSVAALRFYKHVISPTRYGGPTVAQLDERGNVPLQRLLAESWLTQMLTSVQNTRIAGTPNHVLDALIAQLGRGDDGYTLGIAKKDPPYDGHAITPLAVEEKGGGRFAVLVYDNNFPLTTRAVMFNRRTDTWSYNGSPNPNDPSELYQGGADNVMNGTGGQPQLDLESMRSGLGQVTCPFCAPTKATAGKAPRYDQVVLSSAAAQHAHLVITDSRGRRTGIVGGKLLRQIPGSRVIVPRQNQDWRVGTEPIYRIPVGTRATVTVDGSAVKSGQVDDVSLVGPGYFQAVKGISVAPGERHRIAFSPQGGSVTYVPPAGSTERPVVGLGAQVGKVAFSADLGAHQLAGGAPLRVSLDPRHKSLQVQTPRSARSGTAYGLTVTRVAAQGTRSVSQAGVQLARASTATVDFGQLRRPEQALPLRVRRGGAVRHTRVGG